MFHWCTDRQQYWFIQQDNYTLASCLGRKFLPELKNAEIEQIFSENPYFQACIAFDLTNFSKTKQALKS